jgi:CubicO group peptidase (beta-lactamase class C family)
MASFLHMLKNRKKILSFAVMAGFVLFAYGVYYAWQVITIGAAYKAKILCSGVFVSKRSPLDVLQEDLESIFSRIDAKIDFEKKSVTTTAAGIPSQIAIFREGFGCTLMPEFSDSEVLHHTGDGYGKQSPRPIKNETQDFRSFGKEIPKVSSNVRLSRAMDKAFSEKDPAHPIRTRAVVVVYKGRIIAERYAPGISADTPLSGWSMAKSVTNALVGILIKEGKLSLDRPVLIPEWSGADDPRKNITLDQLLRMSSGLEFDERAGPFFSDVNRMLLRSRDASAYAIVKQLRYAPGSCWQYTSGTTNIISRIIRNSFEGRTDDYHTFPRKALFDKIGMTSAVMEVDASGNFIASSFMYASAVDWARFGLLYLQDGVWDGERILPPGWVDYTRRPSSTAPNGKYGAHFWTNGTAEMEDKARPFRDLPADTFLASGYEGQNIVIVPSRDLVVVRLGMTKQRNTWDIAAFVAEILAVISTEPGQ